MSDCVKDVLFFFRFLDEEGVNSVLEDRNLNVQQATQEILNVSYLLFASCVNSLLLFIIFFHILILMLYSFIYIFILFQSDLKDVGTTCLHDDLLKGKKNSVSLHQVAFGSACWKFV